MMQTLKKMPVSRRGNILGRHMIASEKPAVYSRDALVTGNGVQRILVFGNPLKETLIFSHEDFYIPKWKEPPGAPDCAAVLPEVRRLLLQGKHEEASYKALYQSLANGVSDGQHPNRPHPSAVINLRLSEDGAIEDYLRYVNLKTAVVTTTWKDNRGIWRRDALVPRTEDDCMLIRIIPPQMETQQMSLSLDKKFLEAALIGLQPAYEGQHTDVAEIAVDTSEWARTTVDKTALKLDKGRFPFIQVEIKEKGFLLEGQYEKKYERGGYLFFCVIQTDEPVEVQADQSLIISFTQPLTLICKAIRLGQGEIVNSQSIYEQIQSMNYDFSALTELNALSHGEMFSRLQVDMGAKEEDYLLTTEELMRKQHLSQGLEPAYAEKLVDAGRYFLLNESGNHPPIHGHVNINVNHQVSCCNIASLPEMMDVFMRWIERQLPDARENARLVFGSRGFLIACHPDTETGKLYHFNHLYPHHYWISGSGWCLQPFLEYYYCTGDRTFLENRLLPLYVELAEFYEDYLQLTDKNGKWIFAPSYSPENWPENTGVQTSINATMDISVCREVMKVLMELGPIVSLGTSKQRKIWQNILDKLPDYLTGDFGELKEWAWTDLEERYDHRHLSHLYGAYPGDEFRQDLNPDLYLAAMIANRMRGQQNASAHGIAHRAQIAARLKDRYMVFQNLKQMMETGFVNRSFTTRHNPYLPHSMPDAQGAFPSIILESLLYSRPGVIELLPATPSCWEKGSLQGLSARTALKIHRFNWNLQSGELSLETESLCDQTVSFYYEPGFAHVLVDGQHYKTDFCQFQISYSKGQMLKMIITGANKCAPIV